MRDDLLARAGLAWRCAEDFDFLSGGYSNANVVFTHRGGQRRALCAAHSRACSALRESAAESAWYRGLPESVGVRPIALDVATGLMVTAWVDGELLVDVFADRFAQGDLLAYLHTLHSALPAVAQRYCVPTLLPAFVEPNAQSQTLLGSLPPAFTQQLQPAQSVTCHNDLNPWNILVTQHGWVTLDWEFVGQNDGLFDLVSLHQGLGLDVDSLPNLASRWARDWAPDYTRRTADSGFRTFLAAGMGLGNVSDECW